MRFGISAQPKIQAMPLLVLHLAIEQRSYFQQEPPMYFQTTMILRVFWQRWRQLNKHQVLRLWRDFLLLRDFG
jgi:hypothetical protein